MSNETKTAMINLTIDGNAISVPKGTTVYQATQQLGINIPIFCYQDRMPPFGACRVCMVEVEKMGKPQTSCTLEATEGMVVTTQSQKATKAREEILEFLLINHPLDCPICDRGGECPLQDQTLEHGPGASRFTEEKRHFVKPYPLGPVLMLDRERCIQCARCTRFGDIVAGDHALEFIERGYKLEVGTPDGGPAESKYIGNTIMICPVGALTSNVYRFRARPWDNEPTSSSCTLCPVGCSLILDSRDGDIMRTRSCENRDVNDIWLCDKGWFGYEFVDSKERIEHPHIRVNGKLKQVSWDEAIGYVAQKFREYIPFGKMAGWGGMTLTVEENYLFQKLMHECAKVDNVDYRIGQPQHKLDEEIVPPGMEMTIGECEELDYIVLLGLDITEEFPVIWLRLKQAINKGAQIIFAGHYAPEIKHHLHKMFLHAPGDEKESLHKLFSEISPLYKDKKGAIFVGQHYLNSHQRNNILFEVFKFIIEHVNVTINIMEAHGNSMGARFAGMHPELLPYGKEGKKSGLSAQEVLEKASKEGWNYLHVAGADPATKFPSKLWMEARSKLGFLVVQDLFLTETAQQADVVLPTLSFIEKAGTFQNIEGRMQVLRPGKRIPANLYSDGDIFARIAKEVGCTIEIDEQFAYHLHKKIVPVRHKKIDIKTEMRSQQHSSNLRASFAPILFDQGVRMKHNTHLSELVKRPHVRMNHHDARKKEIENFERILVTANHKTIEGIVAIDDEVAEGTVVIPLGFDELQVHEFGLNLLNGIEVEVKKL